ncbi:serine/threonine-protein kinase [Photobacterium sp. J15]|uniref:serine/threonine-protein kinase n=1 Tax=Photobacterium sp. J15 TaxID=265901 RepID=UPI0007E4DA1F|nr:serine/threonine-protein kinase [Photobacterium sp. J15]
MTANFSSTEIFYQLLDLNEAEQQRSLDDLKKRHPSLYQQVLPLINVNQATDAALTQLLGFHVEQVFDNDISFNGLTIDKYKINDEIGRGGMGVVHSAERCDKTFEQELAIKFIQPSLTDILGKAFLFQEAQLLARLNHPYIAKVFDGGEHQGYVYIVMEKVKGRTINEVINSGNLNQRQKLQLFIRICQAIQHAHQNQILHADIKPENVLVDDALMPKVLDFNITQKQQQSSQDAAPLLAYSKAFASPEQQNGQYLTNQSDVFSLGKLLLFMMGEQPAKSDLKLIIDKATKENAGQRYSSVIELMADIKSILNQRPISLKAHKPFYVTHKLIQRRPLPSALAGCLLLCAVLFSATLVHKNRQLEQEKAIAEDMMFEVTSLLFHSKGDVDRQMSVQTMLELTRRRILSNPDLPQHIKQKMLLAMMTPVPEKHSIKIDCQQNCATSVSN